MPDISKIRLPGSNTDYTIKDATAREMIAGGVSFEIVWTATDYASATAPDTTKRSTIPYGVTIYYNNGAASTTGTLAASTSTKGKFYLIYSKTQVDSLDVFDEYVTVGESTYSWEKIGDTQIALTGVVTDVSLNKQTDIVLGEGTTFTNASSSVSFSGGTTDKVLGEATTFALTSGSVTHGALTGHVDEVLGSGTTFSVTQPTITVTPTTTNIKATASSANTAWNSKDSKTVVTGYASPSTDTFVKSVSAETNKKLVTTTVPNVTGNTSVTANKSTWTFTMGTGADSETLIIGGGNGSDVSATNTTLGTAITVATGATDADGTGDSIVTGVTIGSSASAITGLGTPSTATVIGSNSTFTITQPTVALATGATAGTGVISVATGITSASATGAAVSASGDMVDAVISMPTSSVGTGITVGTNDKVTAVTNIGTGTAAAQTITVGTNDKVTALTNSTSITVTKGQQ